VDAGSAPGGNTLQGRIEILQFVGEYYEASVAIAGGAHLLIHLPRSREWSEGQDVTLKLAPETLHLWNRE
jgi:hypothetical protein